jgi:hypothetical protein
MKRGWFGPKVFGWGASPASWEGWLATLVFVVAFIGVSLLIQPTNSAPAWIVRGVVLAAYLGGVAITYRSDARTRL